jgi:transposase
LRERRASSLKQPGPGFARRRRSGSVDDACNKHRWTSCASPPRPGASPHLARPGDGRWAYSSAANRAYLRRRGIKAVILVKEDQKANRRRRGSKGGRQSAFDPARYEEHNTVERCFNELRQFRAVATRYDKRERIYQGTIDLAPIRIWLRDPVT